MHNRVHKNTMFLCVYKGGLGSAFGSVGGLQGLTLGLGLEVRVRGWYSFLRGLCTCVCGGWVVWG